MDFGSEMLRMFHKFPHIGDIMGINDSEKIMDAFQMINDEIEKRKTLFADYGGSYEEYCKNSGQKLPAYDNRLSMVMICLQKRSLE